MHFVVIYSPGPAWSKYESDREEVLWEHIKYQRELFDARKLVIGGPFLNGEGGMSILNVRSREEAEQIVGNDPGVVSEFYVTEMRAYRAALKQ